MSALDLGLDVRVLVRLELEVGVEVVVELGPGGLARLRRGVHHPQERSRSRGAGRFHGRGIREGGQQRETGSFAQGSLDHSGGSAMKVAAERALGRIKWKSTGRISSHVTGLEISATRLPIGLPRREFALVPAI
jgi:hypothetical protein